MLEAAQGGGGSDRFDVGQIIRGENRVPVLVWDVYLANAPVRHRASHEGDFTRIGKPEISDILTASAQKPVVFLAQNGRSDSLVRHA
jgi:hypothetical protein